MNDGDFIKLDYEMSIGDEKKVVATNLEKVARDNDIYDEKMRYRDAVLVVGSENIFNEINESFKAAEVGKEVEVSIKAENAYGVRDPKNIRVHTIREFQRHNIDPVVGEEINLNNKHGKIISVTPGRVLVDYNHQWAGKDVYYKYTVKEVVKDNLEKIKSIVDMNYTMDLDKFEFSLDKDEASIVIPEDAKFDPVWIEAKFRIVSEVRKYLPDLNVSIVEKYLKPEKPAEEKEEAKEEAPAEEKKVEKAEEKVEEKAEEKKEPKKKAQPKPKTEKKEKPKEEKKEKKEPSKDESA